MGIGSHPMAKIFNPRPVLPSVIRLPDHCFRRTLPEPLVLKNPTLLAQRVNSLPAMLETQVRSSLDGEDPLEKGMAAHSSVLAWRTRGQRGLVGHSPWGCKSRTRLKQPNTHCILTTIQVVYR